MSDKLLSLFANVLLVAPDSLDDSTSPATLKEWDSTANMMLIAAIEETFEVELTTADIDKMKTIGGVRGVLVSRNISLV